MQEQQFQFEWDETKALVNIRKHGVSFELASTIFHDPNLLTIADLEHSEFEDRWFSVGWAITGVMLAIAYLWQAKGPGIVEIRLISARPATDGEMRQYSEIQ